MPRSVDPAQQPAPIASTLRIPEGGWSNLLDCLCRRFPGISEQQWRQRFAAGRVQDENGVALDPAQACRTGQTIRYFREVANEPPVPFTATILHADDDLVIADKPHFLAVTPAGRHVEQCLLRRLIRELGNADLVPLHRIDRATAGLVMFSANPATRARYQALFREQRIEKTYLALAPALPELAFPQVRRSRIVPGEPFFRMREVDGVPNSETRIDASERGESHWCYELTPVSGRKHQLRVHMAALGAPILNDPFYPDLAEQGDDDYTRPLKLLAHSLSFVDPLSADRRCYRSRLTLQRASEQAAQSP